MSKLKSRTFAWVAGTAVAVVAGAVFVGAATAQNKEPIKIGFGMVRAIGIPPKLSAVIYRING